MIERLVLGLSVLGTVAAGGLVFRRSGRSAFPQRVDPDLVAAEGKQPWIVLAFTSPLCHACSKTPGIVAEALDVDVGDLERGAHEVARFEQVDVGQRPDLAEALDVTSTPTIAVLDRQGRVRWAREDNPSPAELTKVLTPPVGA